MNPVNQMTKSNILSSFMPICDVHCFVIPSMVLAQQNLQLGREKSLDFKIPSEGRSKERKDILEIIRRGKISLKSLGQLMPFRKVC